MDGVKHLFIVGAGFSFNAGLPLTTQFTEELINVKDLAPHGPSQLTVDFLRKFVEDAFDHTFSARARFWPNLEDIFTTVDLAANSGHHLGRHYSPAELRVVRRAMITRIIRMLRQTYVRGKSRANADWKNLELFFKGLAVNKTAVLSMNWDTVVEEGLSRCQKIRNYEYGCDAVHAVFGPKQSFMLADAPNKTFPIIKMHGSANWLYCDACRNLFWVPPVDSVRVADALLKERDWDVIARFVATNYRGRRSGYDCPICEASALGTRFATFSYRKALDFPMFERSWLAAESLLRQADTWVFIGYSLPAADYQFKHLLKHVQLSRKKKPRMLLITGGDKADETKKNYQKFFGPSINSDDATYFSGGLNDEALAEISKLGALS